jgi:hypothetical protein
VAAKVLAQCTALGLGLYQLHQSGRVEVQAHRSSARWRASVADAGTP